MAELDLALTGGSIVLPGRSVLPGDVGIHQGRIAIVSAPGGLPAAARTIDCAGKMVMPGIIDPHNHFGFGSKEHDFTTESRSAAMGGLTTIINFYRTNDFIDDFPAERDRTEALSCIDFSFHFGLTSRRHVESLTECAARFGITSFKLYLMYKGAYGAAKGFTEVDDGLLFGAMQAVAQIPGGVLGVHCENTEVIPWLRGPLEAAGRDDLRAWDEQSPDFLEAENVHRVCYFARKTGCPVNIVHLSSCEGLEEARRQMARREVPIHVETCPHYLHLTRDSAAGSLAKVNPPVRSVKDIEALWEGVADGTVSTIGCDHVPRKRATKEGGIWKATGGFPGVATSLPIVLDEGFHRRGIPLERLAAALSANSARLYNIAAKGDIAPGLDADLVVVDLERKETVNPDDLHSHSDYSPYEGEQLKGWPVTTILRGQVLMQDRILTETALDARPGRFVERRK